MMRLQRRDWAGLAFALAVAAVCVRLGVWQLDRLRQRRAWNAAALAARERPPLGVRGGAGGRSPRPRSATAGCGPPGSTITRTRGCGTGAATRALLAPP